jgi:F0F1-type ATP synthase membrane subunit a
MKSPLEQFDIINIKSIYIINSDFSFNNILIPLFILIILLISIIYLFINFKNLKLVPSYIQILFEVNYLFVLNLIKQQANNYGLF